MTFQGLVTPLTIQRHLKRSFDFQHVTRYQTLAKSSSEQFSHIFSSLWGVIFWKISPWLKFKIIGLFVDTWTGDYKYLVMDFVDLPFQFKSSYLEKKKHFLSFLFHSWNLHQILNIFKKSKIVIANVFAKLATFQGLVAPLTIQRQLKTSFNSQPAKRFQTLVKS